MFIFLAIINIARNKNALQRFKFYNFLDITYTPLRKKKYTTNNLLYYRLYSHVAVLPNQNEILSALRFVRLPILICIDIQLIKSNDYLLWFVNKIYNANKKNCNNVHKQINCLFSI